MTIDIDFLNAIRTAASKSTVTKTLPWPTPGAPGGLVTFSNYDEWQAVVLDLGLPDGIPRNMVDQYDRARKAYLIAWLDFDLVTLAEMAALATLEHCLRDCYLGTFRDDHNAAVVAKAASKNRSPRLNENFRPQNVGLAALLKHMCDKDGLTNEQLPSFKKYGGQITSRLDGSTERDLADMRNVRMHGNPFGSGYLSGLLELVRDLIGYAYRKQIEEIRQAIL